jgi:MFS family permease
LVLSNPTISATVMITGLLIFSGLGSLVSTRYVDRARPAVAAACGVIVLGVVFQALFADRIFALLAGQPYPVRILISLLMLMPMAFFMGFPFSLGMSALSRSGREHFFVWAWGINGSFSVAGGVLAPVLSVLLGISASLLISAVLYLAAVPALYWMIGKNTVSTREPEHM